MDWYIVTVIAIVFGIPALLIALHLLTPTDHMAEFREDCRKQGMDFKETQAALNIRISFVRVRRLASGLCIDKFGDITRQQIDDIAAVEAMGLAAVSGQDAAKSFAAWIGACPDSEILYPDAMKVHMQHVTKGLWKMPPPDPQTIADMKAAVRIIK